MDDQFSKYSDAEAHRVAHLIAGYIRGTITKKEHDELDEWICENDENMKLFERLTDEKNLEQASKWMETIDTEKALEEKKKQIQFNDAPVRRIWPIYLRYAVAASAIIVIGLLVFKPFSSKQNRNENPIVSAPADIAPGGNKAILTLADGKKIVLDSAANGRLIEQGNTAITKTDGGLEYASGNTKAEIVFNTVTTPKGGQFRLTLSDGSKVWLNAASSISYPVNFSGNEREVSITGEAYFEVAKNPAKPFKVKANDAVIEVLGTHFNINAYSDEPFVSTTLAEGSVKVSKENSNTLLKPGQQAQINSQGEITTVNANIGEIIAWKSGQFSFADAPIENIMRQVARWYDAEIVYETRPTDHFNVVDVPRDVPVSKLLYILESTQRVHFKIEDKKIIVKK